LETLPNQKVKNHGNYYLQSQSEYSHWIDSTPGAKLNHSSATRGGPFRSGFKTCCWGTGKLLWGIGGSIEKWRTLGTNFLNLLGSLLDCVCLSGIFLNSMILQKKSHSKIIEAVVNFLCRKIVA